MEGNFLCESQMWLRAIYTEMHYQTKPHMQQPIAPLSPWPLSRDCLLSHILTLSIFVNKQYVLHYKPSTK